MKIQGVQNYETVLNARKNNKNLKQKQQQSFGCISPALNFLQTNQAIGATFVDMAFMCTPRTIVDFTRSPQAGVETMRREYSGSLNDALLGLYGTGAATLLATGLNKQYGSKLNKLFIDNSKLDIMADIKNNIGDLNNEENLKKYLGEIVDSTTAFNPNDYLKCDKNGWVKIGNEAKAEFIDKVTEELKVTNSDKDAKKRLANAKKLMKTMLVGDTGVESDFKMTKEIIDSNGQKVLRSSTTSVDDYIDNIINMTKTLQSDKVAKTFKKGQSVLDNAFVKGLKGLNAKTTVLGIGTCAAVGAMVQPLNIWLTKMQTGSSGFVGGGEEDKSAGFKALKVGLSAAFMAGALRSIGKFSEVFSKIQFKGALPTIPQFKFAYGITIISRFLAARNGTELRESAIKDTLGFANWLILGGFVSKLAALGLEKISKLRNNPVTLLKYNKNESHGLPKFLAGQVLSREEVLQSALKKVGVSTIKDGKALKLSELMKLAKKHAPKALKSAKLLNLVQIAGYIYSGLALGVGVPKLNIAITNAINAKNAQKAEKQNS